MTPAQAIELGETAVALAGDEDLLFGDNGPRLANPFLERYRVMFARQFAEATQHVERAAKRARERSTTTTTATTEETTTMPQPCKHPITHDGETMSALGWSKRKGAAESLILRRWKSGVRGEALFAAATPGRPPSAAPAATTTPTKRSAPVSREAKTPRTYATKDDKRSKRHASSLVDVARATALALGPGELLRRLGYDVEDIPTPAGSLLLVKSSGAAL